MQELNRRVTKNEQAIAVAQQKSNDLEEEMDARFESIIGQLGRIEGGVEKINGRVGALERLRWLVLGAVAVLLTELTAIGAIVALVELFKD